MRKHLIITLALIVILCLGYGLWLYGQTLRTGANFGRLLERDLATKRTAVSQWWAELKQKN